MDEKGVKVMKKKISYLLCVIICLSALLMGCSSPTDKQEQEEYADQKFIEAMANGLEERWALTEKDESKEGYEDITWDSEEYQKMMKSYIQAELDAIESFQNEKFKDSKLQEMAISYINLLKEHKKITEYMTVDYNKYAEELTPIYDNRTKIITTIDEEYELPIDKKFQNTLDDFKTNASLVQEQESKQAQVDALVSSVQFNKTTTDGDYTTYVAIIENTTDMNFASLQFNVNLLDANGVILESNSLFVNNIGKGQKAQIEFITDKNFTSTNLACDYWEEQ